MQLAGTHRSRRIVLTVGNFSILDLLEKNSFTVNPRQQFFNMAFMTHTAYDFASDARGYSLGAALELYWDQWALRLVRMAPPVHPNQLELDDRIGSYYGDQVELEHTHLWRGRPGSVRVVGYRNRLITGNFDDAIAAFRADPGKNAATCSGFHYDSTNAGAPDLCWSRKPDTKYGIGINLEQQVTADIGVFLRAMVSDGQSEVYAYTSTDRSFSVGTLVDGGLWHRDHDSAGLGANIGWASDAHARYLALGGVDGFIGDGALRAGAEQVYEVFYSFGLLSDVWISADAQRIVNPGFNADRGPVNLFGLRAHAEF